MDNLHRTIHCDRRRESYILSTPSTEMETSKRNKQRAFTIQHHPLLSLTITGGKGISVLIEDRGLLPVNKVPWRINLAGGIVLKGAS